jgi:hypothetical protein
MFPNDSFISPFLQLINALEVARKLAYFQGQPAPFQLQKEFQQAFMLP